MLFISFCILLVIIIVVLILTGGAFIINEDFFIFYSRDEEERTFKERVKLNKISVIFYSISLSVMIGLEIWLIILFVQENKKVDYEMVYKDYVSELYAFSDNTQEIVEGHGFYFLFIGGNKFNSSSKYEITFLCKTEGEVYERKTITINENSDIKIYYDIQNDINLPSKLIVRTESRSDSFEQFWGFKNSEKIISYTFVVPKNSIQYNNLFND